MKRIFQTFVLASAALTIVFAAGCSQHRIRAKLAYPGNQGDNGVKVILLEESRKNDYLCVTVEFKNKKSKNAHAYYRFRWLDSSGKVFSANSPWKPILVYGNQNLFVTDTAPNSQIADYKLEVKVD